MLLAAYLIKLEHQIYEWLGTQILTPLQEDSRRKKEAVMCGHKRLTLLLFQQPRNDEDES